MEPNADRAAWTQPLLILAVVILGYGIAPGRLPLIGEEACRALHGIEMVRSGDWLVPTQQGVEIIDRPPLQYWTLALVHRWVHPLDPFTLRMTMLCITYLTALVIWLYARRILSPAGALVAGLAYPTMGHVFDLGRRVETDGQFTLLMAAALLLWHHGYRSGWRPIWTWTAGCAVAALATLTKGTQAPIAFFGTVWLFLALRRDWRFLFRRSHGVGLVVFLGLIAIWQVPFHLRTGWEGFRLTWVEPAVSRVNTDPLRLARHVVSFPFAVLAASLPWSILVFGLRRRALWRRWRDDEAVRGSVVFLLIGIFAILLPVWLSEGGKPRYVMPLYPLLAVVCGAVADQALAADAIAGLRRFWRGFLVGTAALIAAGALALVAVRFADGPDAPESIAKLSQPPWLLAVLLAAAVGCVVLVLPRQARAPRARAKLHALALALLLALTFNGPVLNAAAYNAARVDEAVAELRSQLPEEVNLVSFGPVHQKFVYAWAEPIPILALPSRPEEVPASLGIFALDVRDGQVPELPFEWEELARLDMDPGRSIPWHVLVGRRIP